MRIIILSGERVALAEMIEGDQIHFQAWLAGNPELRELIADERVPTMEDQRKWFKRVQQPDRKFFSIVTVPSGELIGNCGFVDIDQEKKEGTLRITIGHPAFLGKGLGTEAVQLLVRYGFERAKWKRIILKVLRSNERAIKTYEKAGFRHLSEGLQDGKIIRLPFRVRDLRRRQSHF